MFLQGSYPPALENPATAFYNIPVDSPAYRFDENSYEARKASIRAKASLKRAESPVRAERTPKEVLAAAQAIRDHKAKRRKVATAITLALGAAVLLAHPATRGAALALGRTLGAAIPGSLMGALCDHVSVPVVSKGIALAGFSAAV